MKALSIRAPWWWFILYAGKDIENRPWNCHKRGPIAIQASTWWNTEQVANEFITMQAELKRLGLWNVTGWIPPHNDETLLYWSDIKDMGGHVVGTTEIINCVQKSDSPWFFGPNGILLANSAPIAEPFLCKGKLSFFDVPFELEDTP